MTMTQRAAHPWQSRALGVLWFLLAVRLLAMCFIPLNDTTEARYAEIARKMLETGDWVTLQHAYHVPFWGKPPLSTWFAAAAMAVFGVNALAARLPSLLLALGVLALLWHFARRRQGADGALLTTLFLASSPLFLLSAGAVMTDPALLFATTLSLLAFWRALQDADRLWAYTFFVGLGLGLLAKGPLALVLVALPAATWVLLRGQWQLCWRRLPWLSGTLLCLLIAAPWYVWAEARTPGFLEYFIMGEHVRRFLDSGWKGDLYGFAHATPRGMIWPYALVAVLPWSALLALWLWRQRARFAALRRDSDGWLLYLALWAGMPLLFFSFSGNIIWPYALPALPGFALLCAELCCRARTDVDVDTDANAAGSARFLPPLAAASGVVMLAAIIAFLAWPGSIANAQDRLVAAWQADRPGLDSQLLYWHGPRRFSAEFYSAGRAQRSDDSARLLALLDNDSIDYLAVASAEYNTLPPRIAAGFEELGRYAGASGTMMLLRERATSRHPESPGGG